MIKRDEFGIIGQVQEDGSLDMGDSASRTGIMAMCGSIKDQEVITSFIFPDYKLVRHPTQPPWRYETNCSRDQLIPFVAGLYECGLSGVAKFFMIELEENNWRCFNTEHDWPGTTKKFPDGPDFLAPDHRLHLKLCAGLKGSWFEYQWLKASIFWSTKIRPWSEQNQIIAMCAVAGPEYLRLYVKWHPDWAKATWDYWAGWRNQSEIATALIKFVGEQIT